MSYRYAVQAALVHLVFALILNSSSLSGKVPLPVDVLNRFPPWTEVHPVKVRKSPPSSDDLATQIYPWRLQAARALKQGRIPLWNSNTLGGSPLLANAQSAVFYPPNWLYLVLAAPIAWTWLYILHTMLSGLFTTVFVRSLGAGPIESICSGLVFSASGFMTVWRGYPMGDAAIWLPFVCYAIHRLSRRPDAVSLLLTAAGFAMPVLAGHPETAAHIAFVGLAYAIFLLFQLKPEAGSRSSFAVLFAGAVLISVGVASVQILPTLEWLRHAEIEAGVHWPAAPFWQMAAFLSRDVQHNPSSIDISVPESAAFAGVSTLLLAGFAFVRPRAKGVLFFAGAALVCAGIVYGIEPLLGISFMVPVLAEVKNGRLLLVIDFSLAVLTGLGIAQMRRDSLPATQVRWRLAGCLAVTAALTYGLWRVDRLEAGQVVMSRSALFSAVLLAVIAALTVLRLKARISFRSFALLTLLVVAFDAATFSHAFLPFVRQSEIFPPAPVFDFLKSVSGSDRVVFVDAAYPVNTEIAYGLRGLSGYDIPLRSTVQMLGDFGAQDVAGIGVNSERVLAVHDRRLDMMAAKYLVATTVNQGAETLASRPGRFKLVFAQGSMRVFENLAALRPFNLVPLAQAEVVESLNRQLARLRDPDFDPVRTALIFHNPSIVTTGGSGEAGQIIGSAAGMDDLQVNVRVASPSILIASEIYYPGWVALVDGIPQPVMRADFALMGVALSPGLHDVVFRFRPASFYAGLAISVLAIVISAALLVFFTLGRAAPVRLQRWVLAGSGVMAVAIAAGVVFGIAAPEQFPRFQTDRSEVRLGDSYSIEIDGAANRDVSIRYSLNGGPVKDFAAHLDDHARSMFTVSEGTPKGDYKFLSFRVSGDPRWSDSGAAISVK